MEIGQKVISELYPEYGPGTIVARESTFGKVKCKVFFEMAGKALDIYEEFLKAVDSPLERFSSGIFSDPLEFRLSFLAHKIDSMASGEKPLSAASFKIIPLPHQILALDRVINQFRPRYLLADEVGLGKTIETALIMEELKLRNIISRVLIVTPAGLTKQWQEEMELKFGEKFTVINSETFKAMRELYGKEANVWEKMDHVITSMDFLKPRKVSSDKEERRQKKAKEHNEKVFEACVKVGWDMVIIDEAHKLSKYESGEETSRYKLGKELSEATPIYIMATATPHRGKPDVFLNLLKLIDPYMFKDLNDVNPDNVRKISVRNKKRATVDFEGKRLFKDRITQAIPIDRKKPEDKPEMDLYNAVTAYVSEYYNYAVLEGNHLMIFLLMLYQRIVSSSSRAMLKSLKRRLEALRDAVNLERRLSENPEEFHDMSVEKKIEILDKIGPVLRSRDKVKKEIEIVKNCIFLASMATTGRSDAKLKKLIDIVDRVKKMDQDKDAKILVFTEFIETQKYIVENLERLGYKTATINGKMSLDEKIKQKEQFRKEAQIMVSTDAGGEGINLQFCHVVVNYDLPWNPMQIEQRIGRVDRIGQEKDVVVFNFILKDTIEERVREKLEFKLELIKEQFGEDKLEDVLSAIDEEIPFEKLFLNYISKKKDDELDRLSEEMYNTAVHILKNNDMILPFTEKTDISIDVDDIKEISSTTKRFTELFLRKNGSELKEYEGMKSVYYFDNPFLISEFPRHFKKVIFDPRIGIEEEDSTLFSLRHPYLRKAIEASMNMGTTASVSIKSKKFQGIKGVLFVWQLNIKNNFDYRKKILVPAFVSDGGEYSHRISQYLERMDSFDIQKTESLIVDIDKLYQKANEAGEEHMQSVYLQEELAWKEKVEEERKKIIKYYNQRIKAVDSIGIPHIKEAKMREVEREFNEKLSDMKRKAELMPEISLTHVARVVFE